ncbi:MULTISPECIES: DNA-3-methyladenine glycosylase I [Kocuria]|uniref:DNA-3-methyladenine glycosylase I n=1 Tax=Kocuria subflava TaxID=1736139 RepID=A0A846TNK5_9MICC|nr:MULTISPECIES: DNA-3-methyladenine glycosylase I [Kocuria]NKE08530.1 DNA-3-methyladenine glycosylase I [Kocuria subflava]
MDTTQSFTSHAPARHTQALLGPAAVLDQPALCADGLPRCPWALSSSVILEDHDTRWGRTPVRSSGWFEALALEVFQAGLAPGTALGRHGALREAFREFSPHDAALLDDDDVDELLLDPRMIRNRAKLVAVIGVARVTQAWDTEDWEELCTPGAGEHLTQDRDAMARSLAVRLRGLGVAHVGPGIGQHFLARTGVLPAHVPGCHHE